MLLLSRHEKSYGLVLMTVLLDRLLPLWSWKQDGGFFPESCAVRRKDTNALHTSKLTVNIDILTHGNLGGAPISSTILGMSHARRERRFYGCSFKSLVNILSYTWSPLQYTVLWSCLQQ